MIKTILPPQAKALLDSGQGYVYVDVRTPGEFQAGHVPGATNVPVALLDPRDGRMKPDEAFLPSMLARFPKDAWLVLGCKSGGRSLAAAQILEQAGYGNLTNMDGGFGGTIDAFGQVLEDGWSTLGYPVEYGADTSG